MSIISKFKERIEDINALGDAFKECFGKLDFSAFNEHAKACCEFCKNMVLAWQEFRKLKKEILNDEEDNEEKE